MAVAKRMSFVVRTKAVLIKCETGNLICRQGRLIEFEINTALPVPHSILPKRSIFQYCNQGTYWERDNLLKPQVTGTTTGQGQERQRADVYYYEDPRSYIHFLSLYSFQTFHQIPSINSASSCRNKQGPFGPPLQYLYSW